MKKYFVAIGDAGDVIMRAAASRDDLPSPSEWKEVANPYDHVNDRGFTTLDEGGTIYFDETDQSTPELLSLFA